jgi:hypothetical protein
MLPDDSIGRILPGFIPVASPLNRATLAKISVKADIGSAIMAHTPVFTAAFRQSEVGTGTAPGPAAGQWQRGSLVKGKAPAGEMADGITLARPDFDAPVMTAAAQFFQASAFVPLSRPSPGAAEHDHHHNRDGNDEGEQQAVLGHVILCRGCFVDHAQVPTRRRGGFCRYSR